MEQTDKRSEAVKERDYKKYRLDFQAIIEEFGKFFTIKEAKATNKKKTVNFQGDASKDVQPNVLDAYAAFIPELSHLDTKKAFDVLKIMADLFSSQGLKVEDHNFLAIFRYFHQLKYRTGGTLEVMVE
jgi:hypothetical protein